MRAVAARMTRAHASPGIVCTQAPVCPPRSGARVPRAAMRGCVQCALRLRTPFQSQDAADTGTAQVCGRPAETDGGVRRSVHHQLLRVTKTALACVGPASARQGIFRRFQSAYSAVFSDIRPSASELRAECPTSRPDIQNAAARSRQRVQQLCIKPTGSALGGKGRDARLWPRPLRLRTGR